MLFLESLRRTIAVIFMFTSNQRVISVSAIQNLLFWLPEPSLNSETCFNVPIQNKELKIEVVAAIWLIIFKSIYIAYVGFINILFCYCYSLKFWYIHHPSAYFASLDTRDTQEKLHVLSPKDKFHCFAGTLIIGDTWRRKFSMVSEYPTNSSLMLTDSHSH